MAVLDATVRFLSSADAGAYSDLGYSAGKMIGLLDEVLVNGGPVKSVTSLVVASNIVTVTIAAGHDITMYGTGSDAFGPVVRVAGASPAGLNGDWRLASVPDNTTMTFEVSGISDQTATGTITLRRAPLGWTKPYTGTNLAAYQMGGGNQRYLRVDDTGNYDAKLRGYEAMTGVSTGTGEFPTTALRSVGYYCTKRSGTTGASPWFIVGTDKLFYIGIGAHSSQNAYEISVFGDLYDVAAGDAWATVLGASLSQYSSYAYSNHPWYQITSTNYLVICRPYTGVGGSHELQQASFNGCPAVGFSGNISLMDYPDPASNRLLLSGPSFAYAYGSTGHLRGIFPGAVWVSNVVGDGELTTAPALLYYKPPAGAGYASSKNLVGFPILVGNSSTYGFGFVDAVGPWE